jgi:hypothetical protein
MFESTDLREGVAMTIRRGTKAFDAALAASDGKVQAFCEEDGFLPIPLDLGARAGAGAEFLRKLADYYVRSKLSTHDGAKGRVYNLTIHSNLWYEWPAE